MNPIERHDWDFFDLPYLETGDRFMDASRFGRMAIQHGKTIFLVGNGAYRVITQASYDLETKWEARQEAYYHLCAGVLIPLCLVALFVRHVSATRRKP